jgi:hypothetical protein
MVAVHSIALHGFPFHMVLLWSCVGASGFMVSSAAAAAANNGAAATKAKAAKLVMAFVLFTVMTPFHGWRRVWRTLVRRPKLTAGVASWAARPGRS